MISLPDKSNCCGCSACAQACPNKCISMRADMEGFLYPYIDMERCVHCGLCEKVCPVLTQVYEVDHKTVAFAAYAKDNDIRSVSSSGGIFSLMAMHVLARNGVVFGAAFDQDHSVRHIMIENAEDLPKLQGSKYVQSRMESAYEQAEIALQAGKWVLFTGTPCQTAGLKTYLRNDYDQLYLVDVICHGAPSPKLWQHYLNQHKSFKYSDISRISFRDKRSGWKTYSLTIQAQKEDVYAKVFTDDPYMQVFLRDICLRPACHNCSFKGTPRMSDITLGDAWGIQNWMPNMDDDRGTSLVMIHTNKGLQLWDEIAAEVMSNACDCEEAIHCNMSFALSSPPHPNREQFFEALNSDASMEKLEKLSRKTFLQKITSLIGRIQKKLRKHLSCS